MEIRNCTPNDAIHSNKPSTFAWKRGIVDATPSNSVHAFSRPPILEALTLLPVAYRVYNYCSKERSMGREPILDLNNVLEPPHPGPHSGVPCGGMGSGCIGRGYRGDFRRWSLDPGKYIHQAVHSDQFSIRIKNKYGTYATVLSCEDGSNSNNMKSWNWWGSKQDLSQNGNNEDYSYHGLFPRAWAVYDHIHIPSPPTTTDKNPIPVVDEVGHLKVTIYQLSPFIPENYTESCLPIVCFDVAVEYIPPAHRDENITSRMNSIELEVAVMFTFQYGSDINANTVNQAHGGGIFSETDVVHRSFHTNNATSSEINKATDHGTAAKYVEISGVCMAKNSQLSNGYYNNTGTVPGFESALHHVPESESHRNVKETCWLCSHEHCVCGLNYACNKHNVNDNNKKLIHHVLNSAHSATPCPPVTGGVSDNCTAADEKKLFYDRMIAAQLNKCTSFSIAAKIDETMDASSKISICNQFIVKDCRASTCTFRASADTVSADQLWSAFVSHGNIDVARTLETSSSDAHGLPSICSISPPGTITASAVCLSQNIVLSNGFELESESESSPVDDTSHAACPCNSDHRTAPTVFPFALSWDFPYAIFGPNKKTATVPVNASGDTNFKMSNEQKCGDCVRGNCDHNDGDAVSASKVPQPVEVYSSNAIGIDGEIKVTPYAYTSDSLPLEVPRYYTQFFGDSGLSSPSMVCYGLVVGRKDWEKDIISWQNPILNNTSYPDYYKRQLFNELYYLVDGGTVWCDSHKEGFDNRRDDAGAGVDSAKSKLRFKSPVAELIKQNVGSTHEGFISQLREIIRSAFSFPSVEGGEGAMERAGGNNPGCVENLQSPKHTTERAELSKLNETPNTHEILKQISISGNKLRVIRNLLNWIQNQWLCDALDSVANIMAIPKSDSHSTGNGEVEGSDGDMKRRDNYLNTINKLGHSMRLYNDTVVVGCEGDQSIIGQFLYYEGHEYYMYNTCDVHFYASFSLLQLFPEIELSIQKDYAYATMKSDAVLVCSSGEGVTFERKVYRAVPHDMGSPTEHPWKYVNIYNFQDVSRWKDLGPKFILQIYRDYVYYKRIRSKSKALMMEKPKPFGIEFLGTNYVVMGHVMEYYSVFDRDGDGMVENEGFPDQTYDIWACKGVSAYTGGLWIAACYAMASTARILGDHVIAAKYSSMAMNARRVYNETLWNGAYFDYDNSHSDHSNSIMSDMLAGQWYASLCGLPPVIVATPGANDTDFPIRSDADSLDAQKIFSCLSVVFHNNVKAFGKGVLRGAVNGMCGSDTKEIKKALVDIPIPHSDGGSIHPQYGSLSSMVAMEKFLERKSQDPSISNGLVDNCCLQSREVWVGTTYGLASMMLLQYKHHIELQQQSMGMKTPDSLSCLHSKLHSDYGGRDTHAVCPKAAKNAPSTGWFWWFSTEPAKSHAALDVTCVGNGDANTETLLPAVKTRKFMENSDITKAKMCEQELNPKLEHEIRAKLLYHWSFETMRGVHDAGWSAGLSNAMHNSNHANFGYYFATPEAWEFNGNYRSLGYSRPLCIWSMQYALDLLEGGEENVE